MNEEVLKVLKQYKEKARDLLENAPEVEEEEALEEEVCKALGGDVIIFGIKEYESLEEPTYHLHGIFTSLEELTRCVPILPGSLAFVQYEGGYDKGYVKIEKVPISEIECLDLAEMDEPMEKTNSWHYELWRKAQWTKL